MKRFGIYRFECSEHRVSLLMQAANNQEQSDLALLANSIGLARLPLGLALQKELVCDVN
jgi:hypothetical protein